MIAPPPRIQIFIAIQLWQCRGKGRDLSEEKGKCGNNRSENKVHSIGKGRGKGSPSGHVSSSISVVYILHVIERGIQSHLVLTSYSVESFQFWSKF